MTGESRGHWLVEWDDGWITADSFAEALTLQTKIHGEGIDARISVNES
jgi:hypothetical protein